VEVTNLHRQLLFEESDIGRGKLVRPGALERRRPGITVELYRGRALPATARELACGVDAVVDATDNFASRFLLADACRLAQKPVVHAAAIRWIGTVVSTGPEGAPCYRCLFEDLPETAPDCATAGIVGPVCGVVGGIAAEMALSAALGETRVRPGGDIRRAFRRASALAHSAARRLRALRARAQHRRSRGDQVHRRPPGRVIEGEIGKCPPPFASPHRCAP
jgi:molybdopterin/thiamine biosynthesis adenylyltransferase